MKLKILMFAAALTLATQLSAQTFSVLYDFTNSIGGSYYAKNSLILSGNTLYGTTSDGGIAGYGTVFKVNSDGTDFTNLHSFTALNGSSYPYTNCDGALPDNGLVLSGNILYGTTASGGTNGNGTIFLVNTDGSNFSLIHTFSPYTSYPVSGANTEGQSPAGLTLSGDKLYGTMRFGGTNGEGTVFSVNTDGTDFTILHTFSATSSSSSNSYAVALYTNSDGAEPSAGVVVLGNTIYGTTGIGGTGGTNGSTILGFGTIFSMGTDGDHFTVLHNFETGYVAPNFNGELILSHNTLYGTMLNGSTNVGDPAAGVVFSINTNGDNFTILHAFNGSDGAYPGVDLFLSGDNLYGATEGGGGSGSGTIFAVNTNGSGFTNLYSFMATVNNGNNAYTNSDGYGPAGGLILFGNALYGMTTGGGSSGYGTIFALGMAPSAPNITTQPQSQTAQAGNNLTFTVDASGFPSPNYQWQFNGQNLAGQIAASLSLTNVQFANAGGYSVVVTNAYGSVTSAVAQLTVFTNLVVAQTNKAPPLPGSPTIPTDATHFKVFTNGGFVTGIGLDPSKSTIVITHGWNDNSNARLAAGNSQRHKTCARRQRSKHRGLGLDGGSD